MKPRKILMLAILAFTFCFSFILFVAGCKNKENETSTEQEKPQAVQLAAPQNVRISGGKVCWDEVENASSYRIKAEKYVFTTTQTEYSLGELQEIQQYTIYVYAVGDRVNYYQSKASEPAYFTVERGTNGLQYNLLDNGTYEVSKGTTTASEITVPAFYKGKEVTQIAESTFYSYRKLTKVNLPPTIKKICDGAFSSTNVTQINFPEGLEYIGGHAFSTSIIGTTMGLKSVKLPESLKYIGDGAFMGGEFTEITVPEGVEYLGEQVFRNCQALTKAVLPQSYTEIPYGLFCGCKSLVSVNLSDIESVGSYAFDSCSRLVYINLSERLKYVGDNAFKDTPWYALWFEQQPEGLLVYKNVLMGYKGEMPQNYVIDSLPQGVDVIAGGAFWWSKNLTEINIDGCTAIGDHALLSTGITQITIPATVKIFGSMIFNDCQNLETVIYSEGVKITGEYAFNDCINLKHVTLPESLVEISPKTFSNCKVLEELKVPAGVTNIGDSAFSGCYALSKINIPEGITTINNNTFTQCNSLPEIKIPASVTRIGNFAFAGCSGLTQIVIPENVTEIGSYAFLECSGLTEIKIPDKVTEIGEGAFRMCTELKGITVPRGVKEISESAFCGCTSLEFIYISESVTVIKRGAFAGCTKITQLTIPASVLEFDYTAFSADNILTIYPTVYIESGSVLVAENIRNSYVFSGCELSEDKSYVVSFTKTADGVFIPKYNGKLNDPARKGYDFGGWTTVAGGTVAEYTTENLTEAPDGTVLYAIWVAKAA